MFENVKIGIAPLTWTNDDLVELGGHIPFETCIKEMAQAGYVGCEVGNKFPTDPHLLHSALKPYALQITSQWFSTYFTAAGGEQTTLDRFNNKIKFLKAMGAKRIHVSEQGGSIQCQDLPVFSQHKPRFSKKQWQQLIQGLHKLGEIVRDDDMQIVYHQHMGTGVQTAAEFDYLMQNTEPELVSFVFDSGHLFYAGIDIQTTIQKYASRIKYVHLKDICMDVFKLVKQQNMSFLDSVKAGVFTVPGEGCIDFPEFFAALSQINYQGWMIVEAEQDPNKAHPLTYAIKGREYIRTQIGI